MKEFIILFMLAITFMYELVLFIKAESYIRIAYIYKKEELSEDEQSKHKTIGFFGLIYAAFAVAGMAFGYNWHLYAILFLIGIPFSLILNKLKKSRKYDIMVIWRRVDSLLSAGLIAWIFLKHFHPEIF